MTNNQTVATRFHMSIINIRGDAGTYSSTYFFLYIVNDKKTYIHETKASSPESQVTRNLTNQPSNLSQAVVHRYQCFRWYFLSSQKVRVPIWSDTKWPRRYLHDIMPTNNQMGKLQGSCRHNSHKD